MSIQKRLNSSDLTYATLYDLARPEGQQICMTGPVDDVADLLFRLIQVPECTLECTQEPEIVN
jgi:hypothetical protein